jgi:hypothetical protein
VLGWDGDHLACCARLQHAPKHFQVFLVAAGNSMQHEMQHENAGWAPTRFNEESGKEEMCVSPPKLNRREMFNLAVIGIILTRHRLHYVIRFIS